MLWCNDVKVSRGQMASTRERARAAMATLDRLNPNIDHVGLNWSCWIDKWNILTDKGGSKEEDSVDESRGSDTMTLSKEDMKIYGYCPALDNFYLVVCSHCGQLVKPQAFEAHCERRHGALIKMCNPSSCLADKQCPRPGRQSVIPSSREKHKKVETQEAGGFSKPATAPQHRTTKVLTEEASSPSVKTSGPQEAPPSSPCPSPSNTRAPPRDHPPLTPGALVSSSSSSHSSATTSERPKTDTGPSGTTQSPLPEGPRTYSRTHKKVYSTFCGKKECDPDRHCGVLDPARKTLCTRQLMCNIHSIHQRRRVEGRSRPLDQLLLEQRASSSGSDVDKLSASEDSPTPYLQKPQDPATPKHVKRGPGTNCPILWSREPSRRAAEEEGDAAVVVEIQHPYPFNQSLPSSGESDEEEEEEEGGEREEEADPQEEEEENGDIPATPWHPKPLGLCTFGSHTLGCSIFTFDRRLHHLRFALSDMVEQHVNAHLWKRIPQVPAGLQSRHPAPAAQGSAIRPRTSSCGPPSSPSSGPSRPRGNLPGGGSPRAAGPYPTRLPVGRPGRAPPKVRAPVPMVTQSSVRTFPLHEKRDQRRCPPAPPLHPQVTPPRGPANRHRPPAGSKPSDPGSPSLSSGCSRAAAFAPPPHSTLRRGAGARGPELRGPAQKRKMSGSEGLASGPRPQPWSSAQSRHPAGPPPSGLFSWRKGTRVGAGPGD
ncbi:ataxin-7-like protein 2b isoform X3 [Gadus macrocephalus]|uniref:ataxin-7-like protein 2b isoform X3 n=1 Tax=Gadus macrocephalus TaxID=80720 RepID=UPI0028CB9A2D|nr:ataxin-7-like protein 2b isoform X3 [Gadus macrocephalus]